jgi:[ribosomal protein S18]-alanine N-acetyltransferase
MAEAAFRPAEPEDVDALLALENQIFATDQLDRRAFRYAIRSPTMICLVASLDGRLCGYAMLQLRRDSRIGRLTSIAVRPDAAGCGLGKGLLAEAEAAIRERGCTSMRLEVRADNERAKSLYESAGYRHFAALPDYYEDGGDAARYERDLDG